MNIVTLLWTISFVCNIYFYMKSFLILITFIAEQYIWYILKI